MTVEGQRDGLLDTGSTPVYSTPMSNSFSEKRKYVILFIGAFLPLLFMSKNSPLYPFNDWYDINQFFTVGRGILHGKVPYVDLVDQKGPYLYLLGSVAYLFSHTGFLGWFILETVNLFIFSVFSEKILCLYFPEFKYSYWGIPVICSIIASCEGFQHGGSAEELSLGILSFALYSILKMLHDKHPMDFRLIIVNGVLAGIIFWTKFSMTGLFIVFFVFLVIYSEKKIRPVLLFPAGVLISTLPLLLYFGINGAIGDWLNIYLYENIFGYGKMQSRTVTEIFISVFKCLRSFLLLKGNIAVFILLLSSVCCILLPERITKMAVRERICIALMLLVSTMGVYAGGFDFGYYGMVLCVYLVFGLIPVLCTAVLIMRKLKPSPDKKNNEKKSVLLASALGIALNIAVLTAGYSISDNVYLLGEDASSMPQFIFADIIRQAPEDRRVVLNYGFLDCGVYTLLDQVPEMRYFASLNNKYEESLEIQSEYIREGIPDFVLTFYPTPADEKVMSDNPVLADCYHLVSFKVQYIEGGYSTFGLWEKN